MSEPDIEADLRSTLGKMYFSLADYKASRLQLEKAISLRDSQSVTDRVLEDRIHLANALRWLYLPEEALELSLANWNQSMETLGPQHLTSIHAGEILAGCYQDLKRFHEARGLYQRVIDLATGSYGKRHEKTLSVQSGLASMLIDAGEYASAERELREVIDISHESNFLGTRESLINLSNLAVALAEQGKLTEAIQQQRTVVQVSNDKLGPLHDSTLTAEMNLAESLHRTGQKDEAIDVFIDLMSCIEGRFDSMHPIVLRNLGRAQLRSGKTVQARQSLETALQLSLTRGEVENVQICRELLQEINGFNE